MARLKRKTEDRGKREAAKVAEHVAEKLQTGEVGYKQVSQEAEKFRAKPGGKAAPEAAALADQLIENIDGFLSRGDPNLEMLNQVIKHQKRLGKDVRRRLRVALDRLSDRCLRFEDSLEGLE
jgi:hypothetical protein